MSRPLCDICGSVCQVCPRCNTTFICTCDNDNGLRHHTLCLLKSQIDRLNHTDREWLISFVAARAMINWCSQKEDFAKWLIQYDAYCHEENIKKKQGG